MATQAWPSEWLRGVLQLCTLRIVSRGETYGYAVTQQLEAKGLGVIKGGTLYPLLSRLEADGLLVSRWVEGDGGPGRKFFAITDAGRAHLAEAATQWHQFTGVVEDVLRPKKGSTNE